VTLDVTLDVGGLEENVTVTTEAPLVDLTSNQVGGNITQGELKELPNATRNWLGFVGLLPGIQVQSTVISFGGDSINVNGQSNRNNNFASTAAATTTIISARRSAARPASRSKRCRNSRC
jgi:hypothetical protein